MSLHTTVARTTIALIPDSPAGHAANQTRMQQRSLSETASRLRGLAKLPSLQAHAATLHDCASDVDRAQGELERLKLRCRGLQPDRTALDIKWLNEIHADDQRARRDEEAEAASGA